MPRGSTLAKMAIYLDTSKKKNIFLEYPKNIITRLPDVIEVVHQS